MITPVLLDGSNGPDVRFPYKTGDTIICLYNGEFEPIRKVYFVPFLVLANDCDTGTLVVWNDKYQRVETLDPSWSDFVTLDDGSIPVNRPVPADSLDWNKLDPENTGGPRVKKES